jgi:hypothetical protein
MTRTLALSALAVIALAMTGCFESKPVIPGYHWNGGTLYDSNGREAVSVVTFPFGMDQSQACVFEAAKLGYSTCTYWENGQEAYDWVGRQFSKEEPK